MEVVAKKYTKYEKARMIGARSLQISMGAPFLVKIDEKKLEELRYNPIEIAKMEYDEGVIPLEVIRKVPEFIEDLSKHPIAEKIEEMEEALEAEEELKIGDEDDAEEASEGSGTDDAAE